MVAIQITRLRKEAGLSQAELAKRVGVSASAIGMYEQRRRSPDIDILIALAREFNVSLDHLVTGFEFPRSISEDIIIHIPKSCPCVSCYRRACNDCK